MTFLHEPKFKIGDEVWMLLPTASYNPGYVVMSCKVEEVVRYMPDTTIIYRVRLEDGTITVPAEENCFGSKEALFDEAETQITRMETAIRRMRKAFEETENDE